MKKLTLLIVITLALSITYTAYASFSDVPSGAIYADAVKRLSALGILSGSDNGLFKPGDMLTREQFAKMMVSSAGLEDTAKSMEGSTIFPDVEAGSWSSGYINLALSKGYITGGIDGKFHPTDSVTFAQACTILVKALGYTDQDVPGLWPRNYIEKAKTLRLTDSIILQNNDGLPRWAGVLMLDRLLSSNVKKTNPSDPDKTFADASGQYVLGIVLGTSLTSDKLTDNQVLTDKGTFYLNDTVTNLKLGGRYKFVVNGNKILSASESLDPVVEISVDGVVDTTITYKSEGKTKSLTLPDKTIYYYNGVKQNYDNLKTVLQTRTSIAFAYNSDTKGYEYAVIFDPIYSKPEIAIGFNRTDKKLGSIDFTGYPRIVRNGKLIDIWGIEDKDVVYKVSDIWDRYRYFLVVDNKIEGTITGILPNKFSPKTLQVDQKDYELSRYASINKINGTPGSFNVDQKATVLLGYDGKVVDVLYPESSDNSDYAFVLNYSQTTSTDRADFGKVKMTVKLLCSDGTIATYKVNSDPVSFKGKLVKFTKLDDETVTLESFTYITDSSQYTVYKDDRKLGSEFVTDNIKIFNITANDPSVDAQVKLLDWTDLPSGVIQAGKVQYIGTVGDFKDINVLLLNDLFDQQYKMAVVKKIDLVTSRKGSSYNYTLLIEGNEYVYNVSVALNDISVGSVMRVKLLGANINTIIDYRNPEPKGILVQAIDTKRIKFNNIIYQFKDNIQIFFKDYTGALTAKGTDDIETNRIYANIQVFLDRPQSYGGKVEVLVISDF